MRDRVYVFDQSSANSDVSISPPVAILKHKQNNWPELEIK